MSKAVISIEGFVANELEVKVTQSGKRVVSVSVPHTPQKREGDTWVDAGPTTWFEASFWEEHADAVLQSVAKGNLVILSGTPEVQAYAKANGDPGAKVLVQFPQLAVVVRRPKRGQSPVASEPWGASAPDGDVWNVSQSYSDETPF